MADSIMDKVGGDRPKVSRNTSVSTVIHPPKSDELQKRTVRISEEASEYFNRLKLSEKITVDCLLEAIATYCQSNPSVEAELVAMAKQIGKARQVKANRDRANTMYQKFAK